MNRQFPKSCDDTKVPYLTSDWQTQKFADVSHWPVYVEIDTLCVLVGMHNSYGGRFGTIHRKRKGIYSVSQQFYFCEFIL